MRGMLGVGMEAVLPPLSFPIAPDRGPHEASELEIGAIVAVFIAYNAVVWLVRGTCCRGLGGPPADGFFGLLLAYADMVRIVYHCTFMIVLTGVLYHDEGIPKGIGIQMLWLYMAFNVMLYGGLYTLNQITDVEGDKNHPKKKFRPIVSGRISHFHATCFIGVTWTIGFVGAYALHGWDLVAIFAGFLVINVFYSTYARNVAYLDILVNASTYPLRCYMGSVMVNRPLPPACIAAVYCLGIGMVTAKRLVERDSTGWECRKALHFTSMTILKGLYYLGIVGSVVLIVWWPHEDHVLFRTRLLSIVAFIFIGTQSFTRTNSILLALFMFALHAYAIPLAVALHRTAFVIDSMGVVLVTIAFTLAKPGTLQHLLQVTMIH